MPEQQDLLKVGRRKPRVPLPALPKGVMQHLLGVYKAQYRKRFQREPHIAPHHFQLLKRLILAHGLDTVETRLRKFLWSAADDFLRKTGFTIAVFYTRWSSFDAQEQPHPIHAREDCGHTPSCRTDAEHSARKMREMRDRGTSHSQNAVSRTIWKPSAPC